MKELDATALRHLDALDFKLEEARRSPLTRGRVKLASSDLDFLLDIIGPNALAHQDLGSIVSRSVNFSDHANLHFDGFSTLLRLAHEAAQSVSLDEAIQRG